MRQHKLERSEEMVRTGKARCQWQIKRRKPWRESLAKAKQSESLLLRQYSLIRTFTVLCVIEK